MLFDLHPPPPPHSATNPPALDAAGMTAAGITAESLMMDKSKIPRYVLSDLAWMGGMDDKRRIVVGVLRGR